MYHLRRRLIPFVGAAIVTTRDRPNCDTESRPPPCSHCYTRAEVGEHGSASSAWITHANRVYDVTEFLSVHPGGEHILDVAGSDAEATFAYWAVHRGPYAQSMLKRLYIGE